MNIKEEVYISRFREQYSKEIVPAFKDDYNFKSVMQVPFIKKIVLNVSYGPAVTDKKKLQKIKDQLSLIAGQAPVLTKARKSLAGFHLREGMPIGLKVTLRKERMYDFFDKMINISMPRIKDFKPFTETNFDHHGNFNFGINDQTIFPEISYDSVEFIWGMNITLVTSSNNIQHNKKLFSYFNFPFKKD